MAGEEDYELEDEEEPLEQAEYEFPFINEPERKISLGSVEVSKAEAGSDDEDMVAKTDLQTAMKLLLPHYKNKRIDDILQPAMVSRIFPDNFMDKHFLITAFLIEEFDTKGEDVDVLSIISQVQDGLSVGYEGRGRIDLLEIAGVAHEEEMEKLSKELGL